MSRPQQQSEGGLRPPDDARWDSMTIYKVTTRDSVQSGADKPSLTVVHQLTVKLSVPADANEPVPETSLAISLSRGRQMEDRSPETRQIMRTEAPSLPAARLSIAPRGGPSCEPSSLTLMRDRPAIPPRQMSDTPARRDDLDTRAVSRLFLDDRSRDQAPERNGRSKAEDGGRSRQAGMVQGWSAVRARALAPRNDIVREPQMIPSRQREQQDTGRSIQERRDGAPLRITDPQDGGRSVEARQDGALLRMDRPDSGRSIEHRQDDSRLRMERQCSDRLREERQDRDNFRGQGQDRILSTEDRRYSDRSIGARHDSGSSNGERRDADHSRDQQQGRDHLRGERQDRDYFRVERQDSDRLRVQRQDSDCLRRARQDSDRFVRDRQESGRAIEIPQRREPPNECRRSAPSWASLSPSSDRIERAPDRHNTFDPRETDEHAASRDQSSRARGSMDLGMSSEILEQEGRRLARRNSVQSQGVSRNVPDLRSRDPDEAYRVTRRQDVLTKPIPWTSGEKRAVYRDELSGNTESRHVITSSQTDSRPTLVMERHNSASGVPSEVVRPESGPRSKSWATQATSATPPWDRHPDDRLRQEVAHRPDPRNTVQPMRVPHVNGNRAVQPSEVSSRGYQPAAAFRREEFTAQSADTTASGRGDQQSVAQIAAFTRSSICSSSSESDDSGSDSDSVRSFVRKRPEGSTAPMDPEGRRRLGMTSALPSSGDTDRKIKTVRWALDESSNKDRTSPGTSVETVLGAHIRTHGSRVTPSKDIISILRTHKHTKELKVSLNPDGFRRAFSFRDDSGTREHCDEHKRNWGTRKRTSYRYQLRSRDDSTRDSVERTQSLCRKCFVAKFESLLSTKPDR